MSELTTRNPNGTFPKGKSGNPKGTKKDALVLPAQHPANAAHLDGFFSTTTGIGATGFDKRLTHHFSHPILSYQEAIDLWSKSDLARRAIQDPIEDAFRQGWRLHVKDEGQHDDLIERVNDKVLELKVDDRFERAICMERAVGGSAILIGARDNKPLNTPLDPTKSNGIDWLNVLEPIDIIPYTYYKDPRSAKWGQTETYMLTTFANTNDLSLFQMGERAPPPEAIIHETRLIVFGGIRVSKYQFRNSIAGSLWGEAMLTSIYEPLRDMEVAYHAAAIMATDVGQPTISIENLMNLLVKDPAALKRRMLALENGRSTARVFLLDTKEKMERQSGEHLAGVPDLLGALAIRFAASIPMPVSRLMSSSAAKAIGNEGTNELVYYYDDVAALQTRKLRPLMRPVLQMIMQSMRQRGLPKRWYQHFNDLTRLTDAEKAEAHLTQARTDSMYIKAGVTTPNEIRRSRFFGGYSFDTEVDEKKKAPGFIAPPPHGTPGSPTNPGSGGPGLTQHAVTSYVRKNPTSSGTEPAAKQGGDQIPGNGPNSRKDAMSMEDYVTGQRTQMEGQGTKMGSRAWDALTQVWQGEYQDHINGMCDLETCTLPHQLQDGDGPGELIQFAGLPIVIESPKGSIRKWIDTDGIPGETTMKFDYGYILGAQGVDGDCIDVYLGPEEDSYWVFVIHQNKKDDWATFDEDKVMLGWVDANKATEAYLLQYDDERFFGGMSQIPLKTFQAKLSTQAQKVTNDQVEKPTL